MHSIPRLDIRTSRTRAFLTPLSRASPSSGLAQLLDRRYSWLLYVASRSLRCPDLVAFCALHAGYLAMACRLQVSSCLIVLSINGRCRSTNDQ